MSSVSNKTYYLWGEFTHAEYSLLNQLQQRVNDQFNGPDFKVHLTLSGPFYELNERILGGLEDLAVTNDSIDMRTNGYGVEDNICLLYTSPSPRDQRGSRMPSSA